MADKLDEALAAIRRHMVEHPHAGLLAVVIEIDEARNTAAQVQVINCGIAEFIAACEGALQVGAHKLARAAEQGGEARPVALTYLGQVERARAELNIMEVEPDA